MATTFNKSDFIKAGNVIQDAVNQNNPLTPQSQFLSDAFTVPATPSADGNGLPYTKTPVGIQGRIKRNIITWFIPEFGVVRMYINPQAITYTHKKLIHKDRTKGGYTLQYWGEELSTISLSGTTGSAGVEGINMLYEIYRAEQYAFDAVGLTLAASNAATDLASKAVNLLGGAIGGGLNALGGGSFGSDAAQSLGGGLLGGILGTESPNNNALAARNITSLAQLAFTVEMYYNGWVYRGFFENMTVNEKANDFLLDYQMNFVVTQRRGYRTNYFPWAKSANNGPSQYATPSSFDSNNIIG
jgi:hypothetical protein